MLSRALLTTALCCGFFTHALRAQTADAPAPATPRIRHQVGVQMNELIRQVLNFGGTSNPSSALTNPYLITYSANLARTGWGLRAGVGYDYERFDEDDGFVTRETDGNVINARLGLEKAFVLSPKWSTGVGLDAVYRADNRKTKTITRAFDSTTTNVVSAVTARGGGPMGWLRYHITPSVLVGTEASFYYTTGRQEQTVRITQRDQFTGIYTTTSTNIDDTEAFGRISVPAVIYLIVRF